MRCLQPIWEMQGRPKELMNAGQLIGDLLMLFETIGYEYLETFFSNI